MIRFDDPPCKGMTTLFYLVDAPLESQRATNAAERQEREEATIEARRICATCPYIEPCLNHALERETDGIWGGTTPNERKEIRKERKIALRRMTTMMNKHKFCGSEEGYQYTVEEGFTCEECIQAHSVHLVGKPLTEGYEFSADHPNCGTQKGYQYLVYRVRARGGAKAGQTVNCEPCKQAHGKYQTGRYRSRKAWK
jgi:hypothetical protein